MKKNKKNFSGFNGCGFSCRWNFRNERKRIHATKKLEHTGYTRSSG